MMAIAADLTRQWLMLSFFCFRREQIDTKHGFNLLFTALKGPYEFIAKD